jgi:predicted transcriptional regulator
MATTCTCCRGRRCVRVRQPDETAFESALVRLRDKLARERRLAQLAREPERAHHDADEPAIEDPQPWEMTRQQFEAAARPAVAGAWSKTWAMRRARLPVSAPRYLGLSQSVLRREIQFSLRYPGGPLEGYRVRVPATRVDLHDEPHQAFVEAALAEGRPVPAAVLRDYPVLGSGVWKLPAPHLDLTRS